MKRHFFSQTVMELANHYFEVGDNGFALVDALLEEGFPDGTADTDEHKKRSLVGHIREHSNPIWKYCPVADFIRKEDLGALSQFHDIEDRIKEFRKNT